MSVLTGMVRLRVKGKSEEGAGSRGMLVFRRDTRDQQLIQSIVL